MGFTDQLIKLPIESISDQMIKFAFTRGYHPTKSLSQLTLHHVVLYVSRRTHADIGSIPGIYYDFDKAASQRPFSGSGIGFLGSGSNCFTHLVVVDNCHGLQVVSACLLARERKSLENNANVFQICLWQQGHCN